ncbi:Aste57867_94 [Aphanomyces stellatus]|uniref:Aste57867_94 protein n=1 Tax=Aphanomyces stellatus TaxID=120398 RepID=A0A485K4R0_9STRA|nr:hypothetical protein As57867_000094 [Aphanomyces stellatus]VFT77320.1 Aste57867_94 [Aphanomyces stellatus]
MRNQFCLRLLHHTSSLFEAVLTTRFCNVVFAVDAFERYVSTRAFRLGRDASLVFSEPNAGGQSVVSEALSMEYMHQLFGAVDVVTEMQIEYWSPNWKKVDYLCSIRGERVAVSVTRAMTFQGSTFGLAESRALLRKKLHGLVVAKSGVCVSQRYVKSILHIWCQTHAMADLLAQCYADVVVSLDITENVVLIATVAAAEAAIFTNDESVIES